MSARDFPTWQKWKIRTGTGFAIETLHFQKGAFLVGLTREPHKAIALGDAGDRVDHDFRVTTA